MVQAVPESSAPAHSQVVGSVSSVQTHLLGHVMLPHRPLCDSSRHEDFKEKDNVVESNAIHQDGNVFVPRGQGAHHGSAPNPATPRSSEWQPCHHGTKRQKGPETSNTHASYFFAEVSSEGMSAATAYPHSSTTRRCSPRSTSTDASTHTSHSQEYQRQGVTKWRSTVHQRSRHVNRILYVPQLTPSRALMQRTENPKHHHETPELVLNLSCMSS